jgi:HlyD family secretion protein
MTIPLASSLAGLLPRLAIVLVLALVGCKGKSVEKSGASAAPVLTVSIQPAAPRILDESLSLTGAIAAWQAISVNPATNGLQVLEVLADEGQQVKRGQLLVRLGDRAIRAQMEDANARLASALAGQAKARNPSRPQELSSDQAALTQAQAQLRDAQASFNAYNELKNEGAVTAVELSNRASALAVARSAAQQAGDRLSLARVGSRQEDISIANATVAQARAARDQLLVQFSQTRVLAPLDGLLLSKNVLIGDVATVGKSMFTLARDNRLEMDGNLAEPDLPRVVRGQAVLVHSDALPGLVAMGHVREISPGLNATSRLATVKIDLPIGSGFRVGMFAGGSLKLGQHSVLAVPGEAIVNRAGRNQVFVLTGNTIHAKEVATGGTSGEWVAISSGLQAGDQIVTAGVGFLKDGDVVAVASPLPIESPLNGLDGATHTVPTPIGDSSASAGARP